MNGQSRCDAGRLKRSPESPKIYLQAARGGHLTSTSSRVGFPFPHPRTLSRERISERIKKLLQAEGRPVRMGEGPLPSRSLKRLKSAACEMANCVPCPGSRPSSGSARRPPGAHRRNQGCKLVRRTHPERRGSRDDPGLNSLFSLMFSATRSITVAVGPRDRRALLVNRSKPHCSAS